MAEWSMFTSYLFYSIIARLTLALAEVISKKKMSGEWWYYVHYVSCESSQCVR